MSILNMMFAGSGGGEFKVATPISTSSSSLSFSMEGAPVEYILMFVPSNRVTVSNSHIPAFICHTTNYDRYYCMLVSPSTGANYASRTMSDVTTSYSSGVFAVSISSVAYHSSYSYVLLYR